MVSFLCDLRNGNVFLQGTVPWSEMHLEGKQLKCVDSYCEQIINLNAGTGIISVLPGGQSREEFIDHLDLLIKELFSVFSAYPEAEFRSGYVLLEMIQKYCLAKKAFDGIQQEKDFSDYLEKTRDMLRKELEKFKSDQEMLSGQLDVERVFTIIANTYQLLTSVILAKREDKQKTSAQVLGINLPFSVDKPVSVSLARENTSVVDIIPYLDSLYKISDNFENAKSSAMGNKSAFMNWAEFKYLRTVLELTKCKLDEIGVF